MSLYPLIFPAESRTFPLIRWVKIILRTLHLAGMAGVAGIFLSPPSNHHYAPFAILTLLTGFLFVSLELWSNGVWLIQLRGVAVFLKLVILSFLLVAPEKGLVIIILLIVISSVISHAPAEVRYYSILHGRRINTLG